MRILLIEDDIHLTEALTYILKKNHYLVDTASSGSDGQDMAETAIYDTIILDRMLPVKDGTTVLKELRNQGIHTPVLLLTALDSIQDKIEGLDAGADDYLSKPFSMEELLARIRALCRRPQGFIESDRVIFSSLIFDPSRSEVTYGNKTVKLTVKEAHLLELLLRNKNQVISKDQILSRIWGLDSDIDMNNIELYIYYLRKKLDALHCNIYIETIRGIGYCLKEK